MSDIKIKDLPEKIDTLTDDDLLIIEDKEDTKKITLIRMRAAFSMDGILTSMKDMLLNKINSFAETHSTKYKELEERNKQLEVTCYNLENDHRHDAERIFELEDKLVTQTNYIKNLKVENNELTELVSELQLEKDKLLEEITKLKYQVTSNEASIIVLRSQVKDLQIKSKELKEINSELTNLVDKVETESNNKIDNNFNEINSKLSESIEDLMAYIRYYHLDVDELFGEG